MSSEAGEQARGSEDPQIDSLLAGGCRLHSQSKRQRREEEETQTLVLCKEFYARRCKRRSDGLIPASSRIPVSWPEASGAAAK
jgi:hypothetical protein